MRPEPFGGSFIDEGRTTVDRRRGRRSAGRRREPQPTGLRLRRGDVAAITVGAATVLASVTVMLAPDGVPGPGSLIPASARIARSAHPDRAWLPGRHAARETTRRHSGALADDGRTATAAAGPTSVTGATPFGAVGVPVTLTGDAPDATAAVGTAGIAPAPDVAASDAAAAPTTVPTTRIPPGQAKKSRSVSGTADDSSSTSTSTSTEDGAATHGNGGGAGKKKDSGANAAG